jgi:tetratricopeptide (TPR) repeat protein
MSARPGWAAGVVLAAAVAIAASPAAAAPSVWQRAAAPEATKRLSLLAEAEEVQIKYQQSLKGHYAALDRQEVETLRSLYLGRAAQLLEEAGAAASKDPYVRYQLAEVYADLKRYRESAAVFESIARADPPAPLRARVYSELAIVYARLGRPEEEIAAYGEALRVQPAAGERSRLLANRAEAYMLIGDVGQAVAGYRAALSLLTSDYLLALEAPTTLWGLAVALDRSGDLDAGLEAVRLARAYDPEDQRLNGPGWFYVPEYDKYWYRAIGHWAVARKADVDAVRAEAYARAVTAWEEYVATAAAAARADKWIDAARARLRQCEKERDGFLRRSRSGSPASRAARLDEQIRRLDGEIERRRAELSRGQFPPAEQKRRERQIQALEDQMRKLLEEKDGR